MPIEQHELIPLFVGCVPGLRDRLAERVEDWLNDDGSISYYAITYAVAGLAAARMDAGDYSFADELFALVERLLAEGSRAVQDAAATGLLEGLLSQQRLGPDLWVLLLGPMGRDYIRALDQLQGTTTPGLDQPA